jgi:hypothetical protein
MRAAVTTRRFFFSWKQTTERRGRCGRDSFPARVEVSLSIAFQERPIGGTPPARWVYDRCQRLGEHPQRSFNALDLKERDESGHRKESAERGKGI